MKVRLPKFVKIYRDSITGRFVTKKYKESNPTTTEQEKVRKS